MPTYIYGCFIDTLSISNLNEIYQTELIDYEIIGDLLPEEYKAIIMFFYILFLFNRFTLLLENK